MAVFDKDNKNKQRLAGGSKNTNVNINNAGNTGVIGKKDTSLVSPSDFKSKLDVFDQDKEVVNKAMLQIIRWLYL